MIVNSIKEIKYLKVKKAEGQKALNLIKTNFKKHSLINQKYKILYDDKFIFFPLEENKNSIEKIREFIGNEINIEFVTKLGIINENYKINTLQNALKGKIPDDYQELIPKSYDLIGNIAIIEFDKFKYMKNKELSNYKKKIAKAITIIHKRIISVYEKKSEIKGAFRLRNLVLLYGKNKSETIYKENHCIFKLDIKKTYFTPRLVYEHRRVSSSNVSEKELIVDMFAGVGPFSIQIAKNHNVRIYAFDINPIAYNYLKENIVLNKLENQIIPFNLNVKNLLKSKNNVGNELKHKADRIIMNLPQKSINYINVACFLMKLSGGILHNYQIVDKPNSIDKAIYSLENNLEKFSWSIKKIIHSRIVKQFSPKSDLIVVDSLIKRLD